MKAIVPALLLGLLAWARNQPPAHDDFTENVPASPDAVVVQHGDSWQVVYYPIQDCYRLQVGARSTLCHSQQLGDGSATWMELRGAGHHFALVAIGGTEPLTARFYSSARKAETATLVNIGDVSQLLAIDLGSNEHPWGAQIMDRSGATIHTVSWVG